MKNKTQLMILAGLLGLVLAIVWRNPGYITGRIPSARRQPSSGELRVEDFAAQIAAFAKVDPDLILYREINAITPHGLDALTAIAVDNADRIYAGGGRTVIVMTPDGQHIRSLDVENEVSSLAVEANGRLYVGTGAGIRAFDADGTPDRHFDGLPANAFVTSLAVVGDFVFAADADNRRVYRFQRDGLLKDEIDGKSGTSDSVGFVVPSRRFDLTAGQGQTLWVVNPGRLRLEEFTVNGERIRTWEERSGLGIEQFSGCCNPTHIARLSDGTIVTSEKGLARIKIYSPRGHFMGVVAAPKDFETDDAGLDLAADSHDRILAADSARQQIRVFERP